MIIWKKWDHKGFSSENFEYPQYSNRKINRDFGPRSIGPGLIIS